MAERAGPLPLPAPTAETALVTKAVAGNRQAEKLLCQQMEPAIYLFARRRFRERDVAREFTQDVLLVLIEALRGGRVDDPARLPSFVLGVCRNLQSDRARRDERRRELWEQFGH